MNIENQEIGEEIVMQEAADRVADEIRALEREDDARRREIIAREKHAEKIGMLSKKIRDIELLGSAAHVGEIDHPAEIVIVSSDDFLRHLTRINSGLYDDDYRGVLVIGCRENGGTSAAYIAHAVEEAAGRIIKCRVDGAGEWRESVEFDFEMRQRMLDERTPRGTMRLH